MARALAPAWKYRTRSPVRPWALHAGREEVEGERACRRRLQLGVREAPQVLMGTHRARCSPGLCPAGWEEAEGEQHVQAMAAVGCP